MIYRVSGDASSGVVTVLIRKRETCGKSSYRAAACYRRTSIAPRGRETLITNS